MTGTPGASYFLMNSSVDSSSDERRSTLVRSNQCGLIEDRNLRRDFDFGAGSAVGGLGRLEGLGWAREVIVSEGVPESGNVGTGLEEGF